MDAIIIGDSNKKIEQIKLRIGLLNNMSFIKFVSKITLCKYINVFTKCTKYLNKEGSEKGVQKKITNKIH